MSKWTDAGFIAAATALVTAISSFLLSRWRQRDNDDRVDFETIRNDQEERIKAIIEQYEARITTLERQYNQMADEYFALKSQVIELNVQNKALRTRVLHLEEENEQLRSNRNKTT